MRKHLFVTLLLTCGLPFSGQMFALANPEPQTESQATVTITGTVLDENNDPVIGASVTPKGSTRGASTDANGNFTLKVKPGQTLSVSFVGYKTSNVKAAQGMTVYLQPTTEILDQLVVIGYGTQKRANLTGAVATVDVERVMDNRVTGDVTKALQGSIPGLTITTNTGDINATATMRIRGTGTLSNDQQSDPLIVVDGVPTDDISFLDPSDIKEISVLKDAASSSIYGTRAAFGVILITTKEPAKQDRVSVKYTNNFAWSQATVLPEYSNVPSQIRALMQANNRAHAENELFGMYLDKMLPYAEAWEAQNGGQPAGYREMRPFVSMDNVGDYFVNPDGSGAMYYANWDVTDIMFNSAAPSQKHNVSLEGVSGKTSYRASFGYDERQGLMNFNPDKMRRYNANVNLSTEIFSWLKAGVRFNFSNKEYFSPNVGRSTYTYMWRWGSYFGPYGYMRDDDGRIVDARNDIAYRKQGSTDDDRCTQTRMQAWIDATIIKGLVLHADFTYDLINRNDNYAYTPVECWNTWGGNISKPSMAVGQGSTYAAQNNTKEDRWTMNVYATYNFTLAKDNNFKIMAGATAEQQERNYFLARRTYLMDNNLPYLDLTSGGPQGTTFVMDNEITSFATAGFFGRINYDYAGKYLLEANVRYDGSTKFPAADQWAVFPSFSAGYRFSEEAYFQPLKSWWSNGKIRASYGHIGNEDIGPYQFLETIAMTNPSYNYWLNSGGTKLTTAQMPKLVSKSLTWERVETLDFGLDLGFMNNSLNVTFDWFQRDTKDMLAPGNTLPAVLGDDAPLANNGHLRTRGWELGIGWNHSFGDADVYANFNIYDGKTEVVKYSSTNYSISSFYEGKQYGEIWGFETDRYFEESDFTGKDENGKWIYKPGVADQTGLEQGSFIYGPGDIKFADRNGDGVINGGLSDMIFVDGKYYVPQSSVPSTYTGKTVGNASIVDAATYSTLKAKEGARTVAAGTYENYGDLKVIGNALPRYEYSFRLGGAYKGFDIDMFFQGVGKRNMWYTSAFVTPLARGADATYANQESYNKMIFDDKNNIIGYEIDQSNDYPCMFAGAAAGGNVSGLSAGRYNFYPQTKYLMNLAYLRFKTLTVGYTLPVELTKKAYIQKARIYFTAENLCNLYNGMKDYPIDPEIGTTWTTQSSYGDGTYGRSAPMMRSFSFGLQVTF